MYAVPYYTLLAYIRMYARNYACETYNSLCFKSSMTSENTIA